MSQTKAKIVLPKYRSFSVKKASKTLAGAAANPVSEPSLSSIVFKDIVGAPDFGRGEVGEFNLLFHKPTDRVNITELCKQAGKKLKHWNENKSTKAFLEHYSSQAGVPAADLLTQVSGGQVTEIRGTYAPSDVAMAVAMWASQDFFCKALRIIKRFHTQEYEDKIRAQERASRLALGEKDDVISRMEATLNRLVEDGKKHELAADIRAAKLGKKIRMVNGKLRVIKKEIIDAHATTSQVEKKLDKVSRKLGVAVVDRVVKPQNAAKVEKFVLMHDPKATKYPYYARRGQAPYINAKVDEYILEHEGSRIILELVEPNAVNILIRIKEELDDDLACSGNKLRIREDSELNEAEMLEQIRMLAAEKLEVEVSSDEDD